MYVSFEPLPSHRVGPNLFSDYIVNNITLPLCDLELEQ